MAKTPQRSRGGGGGGPRNRQERTRDKIAAQRAAQQRREARRRLLISGAVVVVVVGAIVGLVIAGLSSKAKKSTASGAAPVTAAPASLVHKVTSVPANVLDSVGAGPVFGYNPPKKITGAAPLKANGKPQVVYVGADYCPYCAGDRWAIVNALSRFGTFRNLSVTRSAQKDGDVPTFSFYKSSYSSPYISFSATEQDTNIPDASSPSGYKPLQPLGSLQKSLLAKYDAPPYVPSAADAGSIPFLDFGNLYVSNGATYDITPITNGAADWNQIAADMSNPSSAVGQGIIGSANTFTAMICKMTGGQPGNVCNAPGVTAASAKLPKK